MGSVLSVKECFSFGWKTFRARPWIFVQAGLLLLLVNIFISLAQSVFEQGGTASGIVVFVSSVAGIALSFLISMGETAFFLRAHDDVASTGLRDLWHPHPFWKFVAASVLVALAVIAGFILLIVPGIILGIMFGFSTYLVIEKGLGPIEALKASAALTKGNRWKLFLLGLATIGINILGFLALIIGLFVTVPLSFLAMVHAYRTLSGGNPAGAPEPAAAA